MWISRKIAGDTDVRIAEKGRVTMSSNDFEAGATVMQRSVENYAPYGYCSKAPVGEQVMILPSSDGQAVIGSLCDCANINSGEIKITSMGGAQIVLKNDGTIMLNSMVISKEGVIKNDV